MENGWLFLAVSLQLHEEGLQALTKEYPNIPWNEIAKMRDVLTHHYFGVDDKVLWDTIDEDFDEFEKAIKEINKLILEWYWKLWVKEGYLKSGFLIL